MKTIHMPAAFAASTALLLCFVCAAAYSNGTFENQSFLGIDEIEIDASFLDVEIQGGFGGVTEVKAGELRPNVSIDVDKRGNKLFVEVRRSLSLIFWGRNDPLVITVPRTADIDVRTASGKLSIDGISADIIHLRTVSGALYAESIRGEMSLRTTSGSLRLKDGSGEAVVSTTSGSIKIAQFTGEIEIRSTSGRIEIDGMKGVLNARTVSGAIEIEELLAEGDCEFASTSGSIDVDFDNGERDFSFNLQSTSGSLRAFDERGSNRALRTGNGRYLVSGKTVSGSQRYR